jgi:hypothetical protein
MKKALMDALRITKEIEEDILKFYEPHVTQVGHLKTSRKKRPYGVSRKKVRTHRKRSIRNRSIRNRSIRNRSIRKRKST